MHNVEPGNYCYSRPSWDKSVPVTVEKRGDTLFVKFGYSMAGVMLADIPDNATFTKREADKPCGGAA